MAVIKIRIKTYSHILLLLLLFLVSGFSYSQQNEELLGYANDIKLSNPTEAIRIGENVLQRLNTDVAKDYKVYVLLIEASFYLEWYDKALGYIFKFKELNYNLPIEVEFKTTILEARIYDAVGLKNYKEEAIKQAYFLLDTVEDSKVIEMLLWNLQIRNLTSNGFIKSDGNKRIEGESILFKDLVDSNKISEYSKLEYLVFEGDKSLKSKRKYDFERKFNSLLPEYKFDFERIYYENFSLMDAQYYFSHGDHTAAVELLYRTLTYLESSDSHFYYKDKVLDAIINNLIVLRDKVGLIEARSIKGQLETQVARIDTSVINRVFDYRSEQSNRELSRLVLKQKRITTMIIVFSSILLLIAALVWFRYYWQYKQYSEVKEYLNRLEQKPKLLGQKNKIKTSNKISDRSEMQIIKGLENFEKKNEFLNNNVSLAFLATELDVNTKYLSVFLNSELQESFSAYINRLRIEYIVGKLKNDPNYLNYKISYLAEVTGYSSHSSFSIAFKAVTGMSPFSFISYLKKN